MVQPEIHRPQDNVGALQKHMVMGTNLRYTALTNVETPLDFVRILNIPVHYLSGILVVLSLVGSFALRSNFFDVLLTLGIGLFGYFFVKAGFPSAPVVLGLVLGSMFEGEIRRALRLSSGNPSIFFTRPISCVILLMGVGVIVSQVIKTYKEAQAASK